MSEKKSDKQTGSDFKFLYWDDLGDSQSEVDNQCSCNEWQAEIQNKELGGCCNHQRELDDSEREEEEAVNRMQIIMRNGNSGEHYFDYFNNHPSSADVWDDGEYDDIE